MPTGGRNTRRTRGGNASNDKTKDKATDANVYTTLVYNSDEPNDSREEGRNNKDATEAIEAPGAPKAKRVQQRPETPRPETPIKEQEEEEIEYEVQGTFRYLLDLADGYDRVITELDKRNKDCQEANKSLLGANKLLWEELQKVKAELAGVVGVRAELVEAVAMVKASRIPEPALPKARQQALPRTQQEKPPAVPLQRPVSRGRTEITQGPTGRERVVVVGLGEAAAKLKEKPLTAIKELAQKELSSKEETKGVKVVGVSAIIGDRLEIQTESKEQADNARRDHGWTIVLGKDAKVKQPAWHPIKVDGVARANICKKTGNGWQFKQGLESLINKSNVRPDLPVKVMKVHWLSRPSEKAAGSMAIYLDSREVAQQVIREGIFLIGANATYPAPFVFQERPVRCYRCNQYGHKQSKCSAEYPGCGKCAGAHETISCPGTAPDKCITCKGAHKVVDLSCEVWQKEKEKVERRSKTRA
jgi:hypothetical protein